MLRAWRGILENWEDNDVWRQVCACVLGRAGHIGHDSILAGESWGGSSGRLDRCGRAQELEALRRRALDAGAEEAIVIDAKEEFLSDFVLPALKANALYEEKYP